MEICSSDRCAVAQQQCKDTLLLAKCNCPLLSAAVQSRLTAGSYHCTYGYLLFRQVCSGPTTVQGHTAFDKVQLPPAQCCCAKQADSRRVPLQIHLWIFSFNTGCAVAQQQCKDTLLLAKCNCPLLSAAVQSRLTAGSYHCTHGYLLFRQVYSGPTTVQGHTAFDKVQLPPAQCCCAKQADSRRMPLQIHLWIFSFNTGCAVAQQQCKDTLLFAKCNCPLLSAAVQNRLTTESYHCQYTYGYLLLIQVCSGRTAVQGHTAFGKAQLPPAQRCCAKQADSRLVPLQIHLWRLAFQTGVCSSPTAVQCHTAFGKVQLPPAQCCCAKQANRRPVPLQIHLWIFDFDTGMQWPNSSARPHCFWQSATAPCSALLCKTG